MFRTATLRRRVAAVAPTGGGLVLLGVSAYVVLAVAGHTLAPRDYAAVASLYLIVAITSPGVFTALEQETNREVSSRRAAGLGTAPVGRAGVVVGGLFAAGVAAVLLAAAPLLVPRVLAGSWGLLAAAVVAAAGAAAVYLLRGLFAGAQRFGWYATSLGLEGAARLVPCLLLGAFGVADPLAYGWAFALGTPVAALLCLPGRAPADPGPPVDLCAASRATGLLASASGLTYVVANVAPLVLTARLPLAPEVAASYVSLFVLARIPVFLFGPVQAFLLPTLAAGAERADLSHLRSRLRTALVAVALVGVPGAALTAALGPWVARTFFGAPLVLPHTAAGLLGLGTVAMLAAQVLQPALVALRVHRTATVAWVAGAAVFAGVLVAPVDPATAAVTAQVAGPAVVCVVMGAAVAARLRRVHARAV
jgi:O-antigen/teichoic acid export membrane protein